jgi:membrane protease YdiL (CAAX protease family)
MVRRSRRRSYQGVDIEGIHQYTVDFLSVFAWLIAFTLGGFLNLGYVAAQGTGNPSLIMYTANYPVFTIALVGGAVGVIFFILAGTVRLDLYPDMSAMGRDLGYGVAFAGVLTLVTWPIYALMSSNVMSSSVGGAALVVPDLMAPVGEEWPNRGALYALMDAIIPGDEAWKMPFKGTPSSLVFTFDHWWAYGFNSQVVAFLFTSGMVLAFEHWYTKRLGPCITTHFTWNAFQLLRLGVI